MLVITLRTVTCVATCSCCSCRTISSAEIPWAARRSASHGTAGVTCGVLLAQPLDEPHREGARQRPPFQFAQERPRVRERLSLDAQQRVADRVGLLPARCAARRCAPPGAAGSRRARLSGRWRSPRALRSSGAACAGRRGRIAAASPGRSGCRCARRRPRPGRRRADIPRAGRGRAWAARGSSRAAGPRGSRGADPRRCGSCPRATRPRERSFAPRGWRSRSSGTRRAGRARSPAGAGGGAARAACRDRPRAPPPAPPRTARGARWRGARRGSVQRPTAFRIPSPAAGSGSSRSIRESVAFAGSEKKHLGEDSSAAETREQKPCQSIHRAPPRRAALSATSSFGSGRSAPKPRRERRPARR